MLSFGPSSPSTLGRTLHRLFGICITIYLLIGDPLVWDLLLVIVDHIVYYLVVLVVGDRGIGICYYFQFGDIFHKQSLYFLLDNPPQYQVHNDHNKHIDENSQPRVARFNNTIDTKIGNHGQHA